MQKSNIKNLKAIISVLSLVALTLAFSVIVAGYNTMGANANERATETSDLAAEANGEWVSWRAGDNAPTHAGKFKLMDDITLPSEWVLAWGNTTLDLNGHKLSVNNSGSSASIVMVSMHASFTLCDNSAEQTGMLTGGKGHGPQLVATEGGAIYLSSGSTFTMESGKICGNSASNGGAIHGCPGSTIVLNGGEISDNSATFGGAIYHAGGDSSGVRGTMEFNNCVIQNNKAVGSLVSTSMGGAIYLDRVDAEFKAGLIMNNSASCGGGICAQASTADITGTNFNANSASEGGAIYAYKETSVITLNSPSSSKGAITFNHGNKGAGIYIADSANLNVEKGYISNNDYEGYEDGNNSAGAAIYNSGHVNIKYANITDNKSALHGGALLNYGQGASMNIENVVLDKNTCGNDKVNGLGGAMYVEGGGVFITNATITNNLAVKGGAIACNEQSNQTYVEINNCDINNNTAKENGGAFYLSGSYNNWYVNGGHIYNNHANNGGAVYETNRAYMQVCNNEIVIEDNTALNAGGAFFVENQATIDLMDAIVQKNTATYGGGLFCSVTDDYTGKVNILGGTITNNTALLGGGVCNYSLDPTFETNSNFEKRRSLFDVLTNNSSAYSLSIEDGIITNNNLTTDALAAGAGVYNLGTMIMSGGSIVENNGEGLMNIGNLRFSGQYGVEINGNKSTASRYSNLNGNANLVNNVNKPLNFDLGFCPKEGSKIGFSIIQVDDTNYVPVPGRLTTDFLHCGITSDVKSKFLYDGDGISTAPYFQVWGGKGSEPGDEQKEVWLWTSTNDNQPTFIDSLFNLIFNF